MSNDNAKPKILCVDDESSVLAALERLLRPDFSVLSCSSGKDAVVEMHQNPDIAVVLSDFQMPQMNGVELLQQARILIPNAVRCVLSGQIDVTQISAAINTAEINRLILKPWTNDLLRIQMLEALQNHQLNLETQKLRNIAITDPVTQLTNHRFFQEKLNDLFTTAKAHQTPLSLLMIDVDHFKSFNDRYGHPEGDRLLGDISRALLNSFSGQGFVSRYGGEEFTVLLPNMGLATAKDEAEKLRVGIESRPFYGPLGSPAYMTVSVGVACSLGNTNTPAELITAADRALYQAKRQGRNQVAMAQ